MNSPESLSSPKREEDRFEAAVEAVISGDATTLATLLQETPGLVRARSTEPHHATLLHYIAANGVENSRQRTPPNAVQIAKMLLDAGAQVDALADMYGSQCTTMNMLVSSTPPAKAGLQEALAETLLDHGATLVGPGSESALLTALAFGFLSTAEILAKRGAPVDSLPAAAGLGRLTDTARLLPHADGASKQIALALATQHGHTQIVGMLLEAGANPDQYNPEGCHSKSTPLHQAAWNGHLDTVRLLVARGARLDLLDKEYQGTPLDWAIHGKREAVAQYFRDIGAPAW